MKKLNLVGSVIPLVLALSGCGGDESVSWGLDRIDGVVDEKYTYENTGEGSVIYILDSGLNLGNEAVKKEFTNKDGTLRAEIFYDYNEQLDPSDPDYVVRGDSDYGRDCTGSGHGSQVASIAASNTYGVAKGATVRIVKITEGCKPAGNIDYMIQSFNYLADNGNSGDIVNMSYGHKDTSWNNQQEHMRCIMSNIPDTPYHVLAAIDPADRTTQEMREFQAYELEQSIVRANEAGIIVVLPAGNDGCDTANYMNVRLEEAFVVGATTNDLLSSGKDGITIEVNSESVLGQNNTRTGDNISAYAPGQALKTMAADGSAGLGGWTSMAAPHIAGVFAVACETFPEICSDKDLVSSGFAYDVLRDTGVDTVVNFDGESLTDENHKAKFIQQIW